MRLTSAVLILFVSIMLVGCSQQQSTLLGKQTGRKTQHSIAEVQHLKLATPVSIQGTMVEKCPVAGCWFKLHDQTGIIKVDTKAAGFTVTEVPLQTSMTVTGKVVSNGSDKMIQATSLTY
ncbi:MAG: hypothetical protein JO316_08180 [Abitibacteriaceae bacterium]|nr:hypothetical protein [Abditibacteriaceae bacterium]